MNIVKLLRHCYLLCLIAPYARPQSAVLAPVDQNGSVFYVDSDRAINQLYRGNNSWLNVNLMAASQTAARVAQDTSITIADGSVYFVGTDQTVNQLWVANGQWVCVSLTAAAQTAARVAANTNLVVINGFISFVSGDGVVDQMYIANGHWVCADFMAAAQTTARVAAGTNLVVVDGPFTLSIPTRQSVKFIGRSTACQFMPISPRQRRRQLELPQARTL